ncbi:MAG TPA: AraC family transcriptional regulator [Thermoanaerobaculia bacterium]|nr:AraC family transcriptional regulator [Thermoanaerobaculia bacterium]
MNEHARSVVLPDGAECFEARFHKYAFERHIHDTFAIGVTLSGVQRFWCGGVTHDSRPGDVVVIAPGQAHDGESGNGESYSYRMAYLPVSLIHQVLADASERSHGLDLSFDTPLVRDRRLAATLAGAWMTAKKAQNTDAFYELIVELAMRFGKIRIPDRPRSAPAELARVVEYLHANIEREIRTNELARVAGMSRFRLTRQFRRAFGLPLHAYHVHLKLETSKRLLREESIADVAARLGFCDQSHFHRRFKGAFGMTPAQWTAAQRSNPPARPAPILDACTIPTAS